jgi:uncharacterized protein
MSRRIPRPLDPIEARVLGALLEKEQTTPEAYPLSLNALVTACAQKTNREPVMELTAREVSAALERLRQDVLVWRSDGVRVARWKQSVERRWDLDPAGKSLLTLLLLRGPQTVGQLRERSERMHPFGGLAAVEEALGRLAGGEEPLVHELARRPGQKESRWGHLLGTPQGVEAGADAAGAAGAAGGAFAVSGPVERSGPEAVDGPAGPGGRGGPQEPYAAPAPGRRAAAGAVAGAAAEGPDPAALAARLERVETRVEELAAELRALRGGRET